MFQSTMMDYPLTIRMLFEHGRRIHADSRVVTYRGDLSKTTTRFEEIAERTERLAAALQKLGIGEGDRVGTFAWNTQEHLEAYFAVPTMGAVLHTLNLRLFPDQLTYVINHAEDKVIIVDDSLVPLLARVVGDLKTVERYVVVGDGDASALGDEVLRYDDLIASEKPGFAWPDVDERAGCAMCYTTGTTGDPKGVVYSHRSTVLHALGVGDIIHFDDKDRILPIVPMFHANAWGLPYGGWAVGSDFVMPERFLQPEPLANIIRDDRVTYAAAVPTIWNGLLQYTNDNEVDFSSLRLVTCGGSAVPRSLMEAFEERFGVKIVQGWGMTETSPVAALAFPPRGATEETELDWRAKSGRFFAGVEARIVDEAGAELPWDGKSIGELEVRGPWITGSYYKIDADEKFHDGWLRTGDVGTIEPNGFLQLTDRAKDIIKSGGEWISSVDLENEIIAHPEVLEAAVIGVPDETWDERPLAVVVRAEGSSLSPEDIRRYLGDKVAKWWLPERWTFIDEIPKTSVGKFDKKVLRARYAESELDILTVD